MNLMDEFLHRDAESLCQGVVFLENQCKKAQCNAKYSRGSCFPMPQASRQSNFPAVQVLMGPGNKSRRNFTEQRLKLMLALLQIPSRCFEIGLATHELRAMYPSNPFVAIHCAKLTRAQETSATRLDDFVCHTKFYLLAAVKPAPTAPASRLRGTPSAAMGPVLAGAVAPASGPVSMPMGWRGMSSGTGSSTGPKR